MSVAMDVNEFNRQFYVADPADYLVTRLQLLELSRSRPEELAALMGADGFSEVDQRRLEVFQTVDLLSLRSIAAETVIRYFDAHLTKPEAPWAGIAGGRTPGRFKAHVEAKYLDEPPTESDVALICLGSEARHDQLSEESWAQTVENLRRFLSHFATIFLSDAPPYNAAKHGLSTVGGTATISLGTQNDPATPAPPDQMIKLGGGPSVSFPTYKDDKESGIRAWNVTTHWLDPDTAVEEVRVACWMLDSMREVGRRMRLELEHFGGDPGVPFKLFAPTDLGPADLPAPKGGMKNMSWGPFFVESL